MNKAAVFHQMSVLDAYTYSDTEALIKLRTEKGDMQRVLVHTKDKYMDNLGHRKTFSAEMIKVAHDSIYDYYEAIVPCEMIMMKYFFELEDFNGQCLYYGDSEFYEEKIDNRKRMYDYPRRAREEDALKVPEWAEDAIVYQIFPERFHRAPGIDHDEQWYGEVKWDSHLGGTITGITHKLDYLQELGVTIVYMTPIFESPSNHKYNTSDYYAIDSNFGSKEDFKTLIDKAHARGMKVIIDGVFNHSGDTFEPFEDLVKMGENSEYKNWFVYNELPIHKGSRSNPIPNYDTFAYHGMMPKLNTKDPGLTAYLLEVVAYWTKEFAFDGWRLDVADEVSHDFWKAFRKTVRAINPEMLIIGEVWYDSAEWLRGDEFDTVMNYKFQLPTIEWIAKRCIDAETFSNKINQVRGIYPRPAWKAMWNLLDSHDTARFLHECRGSKNKLKLAALLQMTFTGSPFIYYGTEVGMTGGQDPDCRRGMLWDEDKQDHELFAYYQKLIQIRKAHKVLRSGELREVLVDNERNLFVFDKVIGDDKLTVVLNNGNKKVELPALEGLTDLISGEVFGGMVNGTSGVILS